VEQPGFFLIEYDENAFFPYLAGNVWFRKFTMPSKMTFDAFSLRSGLSPSLPELASDVPFLSAGGQIPIYV